MAKITIEELSGSLKEYLNGLGLTEAQVQELIDKFEDEKIGDISQLSTEEKESLVGAINEVNQKANKEVDLSNYQQKTDNSLQTSSKNLVGAINELFQNANNGKELIASAIGEPLSSEDTFSAMSTDINSLLSTFKTNMMINGVTVNSSDKFKQLIDKIATMVEEGSGKGVQFASGVAPNNFSNVQIDGVDFKCLNISLNFKPTILIVRNHANYGFYIENFYPDNFSIVTVDNGYGEYRNVTNYEIDKGNNNYSIPIGYRIQKDTTYYWAVGVGEEDTTLRDSLASILEEEGVSVTEEDDMASLISKVDEEFDRKTTEMESNKGLDIISATELPATGNNMQLCAITDTISDSFILSNDEADVKISGTDIGIQLTELTMYDKYSYPMGGSTINLRIATTYQNASAIPLWLYYNNTWVQICSTKVIAINNKILQDGFTMGTTNSNGYYGETAGLVLKPDSSANLFGFTPFNNTIDFSKYKAIRIKGTYQNTTSSTGTYGPGIGIFGRSSNLGGGTSSGAGYGLSSTTSVFDALFSYTKTFNSSVTTSTPFDFTFDISKTNTCYLGIVTAMTEYTYITDLEFILK